MFFVFVERRWPVELIHFLHGNCLSIIQRRWQCNTQVKHRQQNALNHKVTNGFCTDSHLNGRVWSPRMYLRVVFSLCSALIRRRTVLFIIPKHTSKGLRFYNLLPTIHVAKLDMDAARRPNGIIYRFASHMHSSFSLQRDRALLQIRCIGEFVTSFFFLSSDRLCSGNVRCNAAVLTAGILCRCT
jgi:hypothetical protein